MFRKVLIANRGEIALRIIRTLREMDIATVAAFSDADRDAPFVSAADEAYHLGSSPAAESYLNSAAILEVARASGADAVHPGYGFLAENADFAHAVGEAGFKFIGPTPDAMRLMGDKVRARQAVEPLGVPLVPGTDAAVEDVRSALAFADRVGYPVAVKAAGGGGGRGIRVVHGPDEMEVALETARREATTYFKNSDVFLERYFPNPRHVEIQVLGDTHGHLVHLGERDCSVQRRHQKLIEESPSPAVDRDLRRRMGEAALLVARAANYTSAGTVEFLLTESGEFYFLEMNTRIQVEHPVTECVTGLDLIREMVLIAAGEEMTVGQSVLDPVGHSIEVRVNAEDPLHDFRPTPGPITRYRPPAGIGIRVDDGVAQGFVIPHDYDSLIAKVIAWAPDRDHARRRMLRALAEFEVGGPITTLSFSEAILRHPVFVDGDVTTPFLLQHLRELVEESPERTAQANEGGPERSRSEARTFEIRVNRKMFQVQVSEVREVERSASRQPRQKAARPTSNDLLSPMHGTVLAIKRSQGDSVEEGETVFVIEAMKMENEIAAQRTGVLERIEVNVGDTVELDQRLAVVN